jgi:hypothetical protein
MASDMVRRDRTEPDTQLYADDEALKEMAGRIIRESKYRVSRVLKEEILFSFPYVHTYRGATVLNRSGETWGWELHGVRFSDAVLVNNPFELYQTFGNQIKGRSPAPWTFIAQLSNGIMGYLPSATAEAGGGYSAEAASSDVGSNGGDMLVAQTLALINDIW